MAGWNDLPTELKAIVVRLVDDGTGMPVRGSYRGRVQYDAMLALSGMDRELHGICKPLLWKTVTFQDNSIASHRSFATQVDISSRRFVRELLILSPPSTPSDLCTLVNTYAELIKSIPYLQRLVLHCRPSVMAGLLPLLPPTVRRTLRHLQLDNFGVTPLGSTTTAAVLCAFPELVSVHFGDIEQGEEEGAAALAVNALRSLSQLEVVALGSGDGFDHPSLGLPWKSSLITLDLEGMEESPSTSFLQSVLSHHATTLQRLVLPLYFQQLTFPPFPLPHLHHPSLQLEEKSASLLLSFAASPLETLNLEMFGDCDGYGAMGDAGHTAALLHRSTLREVSILIFFDGRVDEEADLAGLDKLEAWCEKEGVVYRAELY